MDNFGNCLTCYDISSHSDHGEVTSIAVDKIKYVYIGFQGATMRFSKNNFGNYSIINYLSGNKVLQVDSINNLYLLLTYGVKIIKYKFDEINKPVWEVTTDSDGSGKDLILDSKDNVYVTWTNHYMVELEKVYNSDGSTKYDYINGGYVINGQEIATDELGNIYLSGIKYFDTANNDKIRKWSITKYLQLVKNKELNNGE